GLGAGTYTLIITDKYGCIRTKKVTLRPPQPMAVTFGKKTYSGGFNISCRGYNDGAAWVETIGGGRGSYTYRWYTTNGSIPGTVNSNRIDNITAGTYYLEVTDALGCKAEFPVTITQPEGMELKAFTLSASHDNAYNVSCNGGNDGSISMTIQGGSGTYNTRWTGPGGFTSDLEDITGLKAGTYSCTVTDNNGCVLTPVPSFTLTEPAPLQISTVSSVSADGSYQVNCNGGTGSVNVNVTGGSVNNYSYHWTTANGSGIIDGAQNQPTLRAGTYHLEVTDDNNCIATKDIVLTEPPALILSLVPKHVTCEVPGFSNGSIDLSVTGGAGPVSYLWSNGATTQDISGLREGEYTVAANYNNTCSVSGSVKINLPAPLTYSASYSNFNSFEVSCFGMADGEIHISPTSGKEPFSFAWTGPGGFTHSSPDLTGLKAGMYNLIITDSNHCTASETIEMREPGELEARFVLSQSLSGGFNLNCAGDSTGIIIVNPQNSVNNVNYLWSDGFAGRNRSNLRAGDYTVVITDDNNCQSVGKVSLTQPDSIKLRYEIKPPFCPDMPDGEIRLNVTGGVPGGEYLYKWSDNSSRNVLTDIAMGEYKVRVEDLNRCFVRDSINVIPQNEACLSIPNIMSPNGDLINDYLNIGMKELYPQMEVTIINRWGKTIWKSAKGYPVPWDGRSNGVILPIDSYHYIIDLHNGSKPIIGNVTIVK
ncbi:MAG TPA: gliding motility-associated C-terminal domain-containing protein, partial [Bacteroidales bacterium]|nr:gliding motility-associated C-terminal domain-containing protein [Bacteroidales bacterium]